VSGTLHASRACTKGPSEKAIQQAVIDHWRAFGIPGSLVAAIPNAGSFGQSGLTKGLFDLLVVGPGFGVGFIELKTDTGKASPEQESFAAQLEWAKVPHAITHGRDEPIAILEQWGIVRKASA
jgi:hypothetical protein